VLDSTLVEYSQNPFDSPSAKQLAAWTLRLAGDPIFSYVMLADPDLFAMYYAACASAVSPPPSLTPDKKHAALSSEKLLTTLKDLSRQYGEQVRGRFASLYLDGLNTFEEITDKDKITKAMKEWQESAEAETSYTMSSQEENIDRLAKLLGLEEAEKRLLTFQLNRQSPGFKNLFDILMHSPETTQLVLGLMLGIEQGKLSNILHEDSKLVQSGLLAVQERPLVIESPSQHLKATLTELADSDEQFLARFIKPLEPKPSTASLARFDDRDREVLLKLMQLPVPEEHGLHVLVYGSRNVDKHDLLARLFESESITGYSVNTKHVPPSDIPAWVHIAQRHLEETDPDAVLVVDRAEQALASRKLSFMSLFGMVEDDDVSSDEGRVSDEGLTGSKIRCVWMTDRGGALSEKNLGRFLFHCEARPGSRADRRERISAVISSHGLSPDLEAHLAKYSMLGEGAVKSAATLASLIHAVDDHEGREETIKRAVHQSQKVLGRDATEDLRESVTKYSLEYLNVAGKFKPEQIVTALRKRQKGTICLYGLPGAGKTQFAEFLAVELDKPLLMKRASDILSKWLGESEQHIAEMFVEAEEEGAILFLDEADSFLRDRSLARAEWSVTQVNELLQQMERFPGVFIAATNLMRDVDAAAMRRFTFKLEFLPLETPQAWQMFCNETGFDEVRATQPEVDSLKKQLAQISHLTPGDFATVKRQALLLMDDELMSTDDWLEQLAQEAKAKMHGLTRMKPGFNSES
jgi:SpoVK/Ycf46/Vps4 family AAA+-type ATPase